jgi:hypothetical protein
MNSRRFVMATAAIPLLAVGGCLCGKSPNLAVMQGYVKTIQGFVDKIAPIITGLDPAEATNINTIKTNVDAAATAFEALSASDATAATTAQTIYNLTTDAISVAEAIPVLPAEVKDVLSAVQLLLLVVGDFFHLQPAAAAGPTPASLRAARTIYTTAPDKQAAARDAANKVDAWNRTH